MGVWDDKGTIEYAYQNKTVKLYFFEDHTSSCKKDHVRSRYYDGTTFHRVVQILSYRVEILILGLVIANP